MPSLGTLTTSKKGRKMKKTALLITVLLVVACSPSTGSNGRIVDRGEVDDSQFHRMAETSAIGCFTAAYGLQDTGGGVYNVTNDPMLLNIVGSQVKDISVNNVRGTSDPEWNKGLGHPTGTEWAGTVYLDYQYLDNSGQWQRNGQPAQFPMYITGNDVNHTGANREWCTHPRNGLPSLPSSMVNPSAHVVATAAGVQGEEVQEWGFVESESLLEAQEIPTAAWGELQAPPTVPWEYISPPQHGQDDISQENLALLYGVWDAGDFLNFIVFHPSGVMVSAGGAFIFTVNGNAITFDPIDNNSPDSFVAEIESISQTSLTLPYGSYEKIANSEPLTPEHYADLIVGKWGDAGFFGNGQYSRYFAFGNNGKFSSVLKDVQGQEVDNWGGYYRVSGEGIFFDEQHYIAIMIMGELMIMRDVDDPTYKLYWRVHE